MTYKSKVERNRKDRERYHANPGKQQQYYQEHIEEAAIRNHEQYAKNPAYFNDRSTQRRQELREFLIAAKDGPVLHAMRQLRLARARLSSS